MKLYKIIFIAVFSLPMMMMAQEQKDTLVAVQDSIPAVKEVEYERAAFESTSLIESQTNRVYSKGTIYELDILYLSSFESWKSLL